MKYIIMCGGQYKEWETPRQLLTVKGEAIVERTIRLLKENGITDIAISSDDQAFERFGVPVLRHNNHFYARKQNNCDGYWCDAFYPTDEPTCYIFGDVIFSPAAIRKIIETKTDDIELFGSAPPFAPEYPKKWVEPFAFKVTDTDHLKRACRKMKELNDKCWRTPISWDLWAVIKGRPVEVNRYVKDYTVINDYTCDIDHRKEIPELESRIKE